MLEEELNLDFLPEELAGFVYCPGSINLKPFERIKPVDFELDFKLQVSGAIKILQLVLPRLKNQPMHPLFYFYSGGTTRLTVSLASIHFQGANEGLTKALAAEYAPTIRVNCIAPSLSDTPLASLLNTEPKKKRMQFVIHLKELATLRTSPIWLCFTFRKVKLDHRAR
ncbi:MAG: SDR family oxidoreductase [Bacteroidetes bacterium]|nr:SDR family oxidoreductase [Bacteroidota bacterium]